MSFSAGESVGPYRIIEQLGQGGMASVFKAYHPALDRYVAIKVLHPAFKEDPNFLSRFQREARVVAKLEHPHIVPIYDFAEHQGQPYLVMKFIEGQTLKARLFERPLAKTEAVKIVLAIGQALAYAHAQGVLHRDIKPSNVLLGPDGGIFLADFGLARIAQSGASTLSKDVMLGTPQYISPEQAKGTGELDEGTDIYSLGVLLYEIVVGRVPFNADTPFSIIHDHIYTPLPPPTVINPHVPPAVEQVLMKALEKSRADRFESVDQLLQAFQAAVLGGAGSLDATPPEASAPDRQPTQVSEPTPLRPGSEVELEPPPAESDSGVKKKRRWPWVAGGIAISLICLFVFIVNAANRNNAQPDPASPPDASATDALSVPTLEPDAMNSPESHFERAERLMRLDRSLLAAEEYMNAADLYTQQGRFVEAVESYARAIAISPFLVQRNRESADLITQAFFMAAPDEGVAGKLEQLDQARVEWKVLPAIVARAELHQGNPDEARARVGASLETDPANPYALAVLAEINLLSGERAEAQRILEKEIRRGDQLPQWLLDHLVGLQGQL